MNEALILQELEGLAAKLAIEVVYDGDLEDSRGGLCRFGGRSYLYVNQALTVSERVNLFLSVLAGRPLDGVFVKSQVRELLEARNAAMRV